MRNAPELSARWVDLHCRLLIAAFALSAALWGVYTLRAGADRIILERLAVRILRGESYSPSALASQVPMIERVEAAANCQPQALWSAAVIRLHRWELAALQPEGAAAELGEPRSLDTSLRRALGCTPSDPFLWLALYWLHRQDPNGGHAAAQPFLERSYILGRHEGWIALKRNTVAFMDYERLPVSLRQEALREYGGLVRSGFYEPAARILAGPARRLFPVILPVIERLPPRQRETLAKHIRWLGEDSLQLPSAERPVGPTIDPFKYPAGK